MKKRSDIEEISSFNAHRKTEDPDLSKTDLRRLIPDTGLREYWYPAVLERKVGKDQPTYLKILGEEIILFRGKEGRVAALGNACPHRGSFLANGDCHYTGTVSCSYHGWTFDETGECVAVLGEGPESRIPGLKTARARHYPTQTLKGVVFVWIGDGEAAPIEEDVPEEFFDSDSMLMYSVTSWDCNWRVAVENYLDAHVYYVHRNSVWFQLLPAEVINAFAHMGSQRPKPHVVNGRALTYRFDETPVRAQLGVGSTDAPAKSQDFQDVYPGLDGAKWPKNGWRIYWNKFVGVFYPKRNRPPLVRSEEWGGFHLPTTIRVDYRHFLYTRVSVPVDATKTRIFYYHTTRPKSWFKKCVHIISFYIWRNWLVNYNFSGQDERIVTTQSYEAPEQLSGTDRFPLETRRLIVTHARGAKSNS